MIDYKELMLFSVTILAFLFGIYQYLKKNSKENVVEAKTIAKEANQLEIKLETQNTLVMNELKHISSNVDSIKTEVKILTNDHNKNHEDILILGESHKSLSDKLNTAFEKLDAIRNDVESLEPRVKYLEDLRKT